MAGLRLVMLLAILSTRVMRVAPADAPEAAVPVPATSLSIDAIRSDFDLLRHALEEAHPGLYRFRTKAEMDRTFAAERAKLDHPMTRPEFREVVAETLASMRCGHTSMNRDAEMDAAFKSSPAFPLSI